MNFLHHFRTICRQFFYILTSSVVLHGSFLVQLAHEEYIAIERCFNELADSFRVEKLVLELLPLRFRIKLDVSIAHSVLNFCWRDNDLVVLLSCGPHNLRQLLLLLLCSWIGTALNWR